MDPIIAAFLRGLLAIDDPEVMRDVMRQFLSAYDGPQGPTGAPAVSGTMKPYQRAAGAGGSSPGPGSRINTNPLARAAALARLPPDQRASLARVFGPRTSHPTVGRTAHGELVMSHIGNLPPGVTPLPPSGAPARKRSAA